MSNTNYKTSTVTLEQIQLLDSIGFVLQINGNRKLSTTNQARIQPPISVSIHNGNHRSLFSAFPHITEDKKQLNNLMKNIIPRCCNDQQDCLKQPMNNLSMQQLLASSAPNLYYGMNVKIGEKIDGKHTVYRRAYATGSGSSTVCLDPSVFQINHFSVDHLRLIKIMAKIYT
jgi:hypothetical protein